MTTYTRYYSQRKETDGMCSYGWLLKCKFSGGFFPNFLLLLFRPLSILEDSIDKDTNIIPGEHKVQILKYVTEPDWASQNETNKDHIITDSEETTVCLDREKTLSMEYMNMRNCTMQRCIYLGISCLITSVTLCFHLWNREEYCKVTSSKHTLLS